MPEEESGISIPRTRPAPVSAAVVAFKCLVSAIAPVVASAFALAFPLAFAPVAAAVPAWAAGLVDVRTVVPDAVIDLRYATTDNFVGEQLYPTGSRCLVHESMARGLATAAAGLRPDRLVFWDCYRPHEVQVRMFEIVPDPAWVARPGTAARSHEAGRSVDVTIAGADMGTGFDDFSPHSGAYATDGVSPAARANRARLREAMRSGGLSPYAGEWWHFDGPGAGEPRPFLDVPLP
ncbi:D-alanyl-D-alanine dipeptidase [Mycolicibacterium goodii]|uniref:M15 family metallopeptidase n=1 Tax=Mycolicibacterium goodii TaxID=134601 RepID=UPI001BDDB91A|nr:M15 family metallopeptidase [Mycolicibacterium goodii]MBU8810885.1 D-alanyl-D-alanine dipeptidase [Mycolicibacterium goodii]